MEYWTFIRKGSNMIETKTVSHKTKHQRKYSLVIVKLWKKVRVSYRMFWSGSVKRKHHNSHIRLFIWSAKIKKRQWLFCALANLGLKSRNQLMTKTKFIFLQDSELEGFFLFSFSETKKIIGEVDFRPVKGHALSGFDTSHPLGR